MTTYHGFIIPIEMFALCGQHEDFEAANRVLGPIPLHRRPVIIRGQEYHFYRVSSGDNPYWPTTGQFRFFNIQVLAPGSLIVGEEIRSDTEGTRQHCPRIS